MSSIVWFRLDLRLADNPALEAAAKRGGAVVPVFVWAPDEDAPWAPGAASRWWLHQSLRALDERLRDAGSRLIIRRGPTVETLRALAAETSAGAVFWNRRYEPASIARDAEVAAGLRRTGLVAESFNAALLHEPSTIRNRSGQPFRVFTPFWRHCLGLPDDPDPPPPAPRRISRPSRWPESLALAALALEPRAGWAQGMRAAWRPGELGAAARLKSFLANAFESYAERRDRPDVAGTSRLSPHLHFGEIGPRQIWHALRRKAARRGFSSTWRGSQFLAELGWREFAHHLLYHFPQTQADPLRAEFERFAWRPDDSLLDAWRRGRTGYPVVDAGMRELWTTGWMHNRVRMIAASFLVKDLLIDWRDGARWFWDTLVDADLAQNTLGWQWTAGCGADAAPYFRVFNPTSQGQKFDPRGDYVRRWCPELAKLPEKWVHRPHEAPPGILRAAEIELGHTYPQPLIDHGAARKRALAAYARMRVASRRHAL